MWRLQNRLKYCGAYLKSSSKFKIKWHRLVKKSVLAEVTHMQKHVFCNHCTKSISKNIRLKIHIQLFILLFLQRNYKVNLKQNVNLTQTLTLNLSMGMSHTPVSNVNIKQKKMKHNLTNHIKSQGWCSSFIESLNWKLLKDL